MSEKTTDPVVFMRSTIIGNSGAKKFVPGSGRRLQLYIGGHKDNGNKQLVKLIADLTKLVDSPRGAKLDIHSGTKEYEGRTFASSFMYIKGVEEKTETIGFKDKEVTESSTEAKAAELNKESA